MTGQRGRRFTDRSDAARQLAAALSRYRGRHPLVLAIPRGGVPVGRVVAEALGGELDVVLVRKLGAPDNPELAIGAIDESGSLRLAHYASGTGANHDYVRRESQRQLDLIRERRMRYCPHRPPLSPTGRTVIVVDDGLATGATMGAALAAVRAQRPARLICAVPVAAKESLESVSSLADEIVCLSTPDDFYAVGQFYADFSAVDDDEVVSLLGAQSDRSQVQKRAVSTTVRLAVGGVQVDGDLDIPADATGVVVFAHGSGSGRKSSRNRFVALELNRHGLATLLFDLLTEEEDTDRAARFDIDLLAARLEQAVAWATRDTRVGKLPLGLFGASTGAAAALIVAARQRDRVTTVVSRGGRPDLAGGGALSRVVAPTLLIVGGADEQVLGLNRAAQKQMPGTCEVVVVPGATHLFEEQGALEKVAEVSANWFQRWLVR
jgi:putative phosphoribosyl transferase